MNHKTLKSFNQSSVQTYKFLQNENESELKNIEDEEINRKSDDK